tara:strand:- start:4502 stop:6568 length:2067 start_codon:yes stop_codon:yes gene_type:complete
MARRLDLSANFDIQTIIMQMPAHIFCVDKNNIIIGCNLSQANSLGYETPDDLIGLALIDILTPVTFEPIAANNQRVMDEKKTIVLEEPFEHPTLGIRQFLSSKSPLTDLGGEVIGVIGVAQDVTNIKHYEQEALEHAYQQLTTYQKDANTVSQFVSEITGVPEVSGTGAPLEYLHKVRNYYQSLIALMPGHVYWVDRNGRILGCNNRQAKSFGYQHHEEIVGKHYHDLLPKHEADALLQINQSVMHNQHIVTTEETGTMDCGIKRTYFSTKSPLFTDAGDVIGILGTSIDITERKNIENKLIESQKKAEVASHAKTEFLMNMSHDLRTPFSGILGLSQLLHDEEQDSNKKALLGDIVTSGRQLLNLLNEIIDYTRVETGEQTGEFHANQDKVDLPQLIHEVFGLFAAELQRKSLKTFIDYASGTPKLFVTDRVMLHRILLNLLSNAVKFTQEGTITVSVNKSEKGITIAVEDTGIGMVSDVLEKIFEKFSRASLAHEGFYQGTGLGLSLVQRMVSCLQGHVTVKSELHVGTEFVCHLPLEALSERTMPLSRPRSSRIISSDVKPILDSIFRANPRVLVVEDDSISQRVAQYLLEGCGCEVSLSGTAAQACVQDMTYYDLVLIDLGLPDRSGVEVAQYVRMMLGHSPKHRPHLVALTAYVDDDFLASYQEKGFDFVLRKPLTYGQSITV